MTIEFAKVRTESALEFSRARLEFKDGLGNFNIEIIKWIVGAIAFDLIGTMGFIIALVEYLGH